MNQYPRYHSPFGGNIEAARVMKSERLTRKTDPDGLKMPEMQCPTCGKWVTLSIKGYCDPCIEEAEFKGAVEKYNKICDELEEKVFYELRDYRRLKLSDLYYHVQDDFEKVKQLIEDAKKIVEHYNIKDDSRLEEIIEKFGG